jgi:kynureninase
MSTGTRDLTAADARELDAQDELASFRQRFVPIRDPGVIAYLDGNSLGRPLKATLARLTRTVESEWGTRMIRAWSESWLDLPEKVGDELAAAGLGAASGQTILADSTSVNLYKILSAAVVMRPGRTEIVTDTANFPTDRYLVESIARERGMTVRWIQPDPSTGVTPQQVRDALTRDTAAVALSHVDYRSAHIADMPAINDVAHRAGALVIWDLCHSVGVIPLELDAAGTDFAVGCTYKFLNAGPGSPAFLYARAEHHNNLDQPISGWMGADDIFRMGPEFHPAPGIRRALSGTPGVLGIAAAQEGIALVAEAGIDRIRAKSVALTRLTIEFTDRWLVPLGFEVGSPRQDARRGGHVTLRHPDAATIARTLIDSGVIVDFREPDGIRLGLSPLSTSFNELFAAMSQILETARQSLAVRTGRSLSRGERRER